MNGIEKAWNQLFKKIKTKIEEELTIDSLLNFKNSLKVRIQGINKNYYDLICKNFKRGSEGTENSIKKFKNVITAQNRSYVSEAPDFFTPKKGVEMESSKLEDHLKSSIKLSPEMSIDQILVRRKGYKIDLDCEGKSKIFNKIWLTLSSKLFRLDYK